MSPRLKNAIWFTIPAVATAGVLTAISIPGLDEIRQEVGGATLTETLTALVVFAGAGGMLVGGISYGLRRLITRHRTKP